MGGKGEKYMGNIGINKTIKKIDKWVIQGQVKITKRFMESRFCIAGDNAGMGVIEVVLIIVVLVGLAFTFKSKISTVLNSIFSKITSKVDSF